MRILVIDDDPLLVLLFRRMFQQHATTSVASAAEALALLAEGAELDVILCDMHMPKMGGIAFSAALEGAWPALATRVLFMSGGALDQKEQAFLSDHPTLTKPFGLEDFYEAYANLPASDRSSERRSCALRSRSAAGA